MIKWIVLAFAAFFAYSMYEDISTVRESSSETDNKTTTQKAPANTQPPAIPLGKWKTGFYVDEFGDTTEEGYVTLTSSGSFSNSATTGSALEVRMFINSGTRDPWFRLYEYAGNNSVKGTYSNSKLNTLRCRVKQSESETYSVDFTQFQGADSFQVAGDSKQKLSQAILSEGSVKVSCYKIETPTTKYKFALDFEFFDNAIAKVETQTTT